MQPIFRTMGDSAIQIEFGQEITPEINDKMTAFLGLIKAQKIEGIIDTIPAFCTLLIHYDPRIITYQSLLNRLEVLTKLELTIQASSSRIFEIPVLYGGEYGPDLENIAKLAKMSAEQVIAIHSATDYLIYMLGFMPGFSYLGGLDERIHTPRLDSPRLKIPSGSVGIGGAQTGIYPLESPGGWQLLGRTPIKTYDVNRAEPILYDAGDYIRFVPVTEKEYHEIATLVEKNQYQCVVHRKELS